ncbi:MAG: FkbM family methyltransferase [Bacteroidales bacterium]|jgi:FkbM family methyltransferase|nr:FkbM family methyltransferase [Bacteroidales bacterium]
MTLHTYYTTIFIPNIYWFAINLKQVGLYNALKFIFIKRFGGKITPRGYKFPIFIRDNSSDSKVFEQVISGNCYNLEKIMRKKIELPAVVVDCGANVGLSSVFFANKYPNAQIIAVEPEENNYRHCLKNTRDYPQISCLQKGIWDKSCFLKIKNSKANSWGFQVLESVAETNISAMSITDLANQYNLKQIDILKIDIEGSEKQIFEYGADDWLPMVKILIVELHDRSVAGCSEALFKALRPYKFEVFMKGDNLIVSFIK